MRREENDEDMFIEHLPHAQNSLPFIKIDNGRVSLLERSCQSLEFYVVP